MQSGRINAGGDTARKLVSVMSRCGGYRRKLISMTQWRLARLVVRHAADGIPRRTLVEDLCLAGLHPVDAAILVAEGGPSQTLREWLVMAAGLTIAIDAEHVRRVLALAGEPEGGDLAAEIRASEQEERAIAADINLYGREIDED